MIVLGEYKERSTDPMCDVAEKDKITDATENL